MKKNNGLASENDKLKFTNKLLLQGEYSQSSFDEIQDIY